MVSKEDDFFKEYQDVNDLYEKYFYKEYKYEGRIYPNLYSYLISVNGFTKNNIEELNILAYSNLELIDKSSNTSIFLRLYIDGILDLDLLSDTFMSSNINTNLLLKNEDINFFTIFFKYNFPKFYLNNNISLFHEVLFDIKSKKKIYLHEYLFDYEPTSFNNAVINKIANKDLELSKLYKIYPYLKEHLIYKKIEKLWDYFGNYKNMIIEELKSIPFNDLKNDIDTIIKIHNNTCFEDFIKENKNILELNRYLNYMNYFNIICGNYDNYIDEIKAVDYNYQVTKINLDAKWFYNFLLSSSNTGLFFTNMNTINNLWGEDYKHRYYQLISNLSNNDLIKFINEVFCSYKEAMLKDKELSLDSFYKSLLNLNLLKLLNIYKTIQDYQLNSYDINDSKLRDSVINLVNLDFFIDFSEYLKIYNLEKIEEFINNDLNNDLTKILTFFHEHHISVSKESLVSIVNIKSINAWLLDRKKSHTSGYSEKFTNNIFIIADCNLYANYFHELLHHYSNNRDKEKIMSYYLTGFDKDDINSGFNETITQYITLKLFPYSKTSYNDGVDEFRKIMNLGIFNEDELINAYFHNDIIYLDKKMQEVGSSFKELSSKFNIVIGYYLRSKEEKERWHLDIDMYLDKITKEISKKKTKGDYKLIKKYG